MSANAERQAAWRARKRANEGKPPIPRPINPATLAPLTQLPTIAQSVTPVTSVTPAKSQQIANRIPAQPSTTQGESRARVASVEVWEQFLQRWERGDAWMDIAPDLPVGTDWGSLQRRGTQSGADERERWDNAQTKHRAARLKWIAEKAAKAAYDVKTLKTTTKRGPDGGITEQTHIEETRHDAAMARLAGEIEANGQPGSAGTTVNVGPGAGGTFQIAVQLDSADPAHARLAEVLERRRAAGRVVDVAPETAQNP